MLILSFSMTKPPGRFTSPVLGAAADFYDAGKRHGGHHQ
jgi:hypothetical protein